MTRVFDCFLFHDELDMLECRLTELEDVVDFFVLVEAPTTHQGAGKPSYYLDNVARFARWNPRIQHVLATGVIDAAPDAMGREQAQRERMRDGLVALGALPDDLVLLSDVDEIPAPGVVRALRENPPDVPVTLWNRLCCFAVDWEYPAPWPGTAAARYRDIPSFSEMRAGRPARTRIPDAGWHLSWLGGPAATLSKLLAFTHPEIIASTQDGLLANQNFREGRHVDGVKLLPVDVDGTWPAYVRERRCPANWFRERARDWSSDLWPLIDTIPGWLTEEEAWALFLLARDEPAPMFVAEIGAYLGRSSAAIAAGLRERGAGALRLYSVDTWTGVTGDPFYAEQLLAAGATDMRSTHLSNMHRLGLNDHIQRCYLDEMPEVHLGLLFIDGDHSYKACRGDVERWGPLIREGGVLAFHDRSAPGPARVIAELPGWYEPVSTAGELAIFSKTRA